MTVGRPPAQGQGFGLPDFFWLQGMAGGNNQNTQPSVTALAGGGQAGATLIGATNAQGIEAWLVEIRTVATIADSVQLPQAIAGKAMSVYNSSANSCNIYANANLNKANGNVGDTINGAATGNAYALAGGKSVDLFCPRNGIWAAAVSA